MSSKKYSASYSKRVSKMPQDGTILKGQSRCGGGDLFLIYKGRVYQMCPVSNPDAWEHWEWAINRHGPFRGVLGTGERHS